MQEKKLRQLAYVLCRLSVSEILWWSLIIGVNGPEITEFKRKKTDKYTSFVFWAKLYIYKINSQIFLEYDNPHLIGQTNFYDISSPVYSMWKALFEKVNTKFHKILVFISQKERHNEIAFFNTQNCFWHTNGEIVCSCVLVMQVGLLNLVVLILSIWVIHSIQNCTNIVGTSYYASGQLLFRRTYIFRDQPT